MSSFSVTYRLAVAPSEGLARAEAIALEQSVELPRDALPADFEEPSFVPAVAGIEEHPEGGVLATLDVPVVTTGYDAAQLLNVLFGNASLLPDVELVAVEPSLDARVAFGGPRHGIAGLRALCGAPSRPLTCTALKPMGLAPAELARRAALFARAGVDIIKDDHGLADHPFCPFDERVRACQKAVEDVAQETGRRALYAPNLLGAPAEVFRQAEEARRCGVGAVLVAPMLVGPALFHRLAQAELDVPVLAHPALGGAARIAATALLGTLFRLWGADAVIYPHHGGRFDFGAEVCRGIAGRLRHGLEPLRPAFPVAAGGMEVERIDELVGFYGRDVVLLLGGSLYRAGGDLEARTRRFVEAVAESASEEE
jgi:ribulose-bisphosphate carboxylase large chain